ncbi:FAD:protein FMN transferase [Micromonospora sp. NPDC000089]|uniref:FAD:protein FMN transferase n=1 Tax=unclassified Micromonospora TaxID=2617518 RepID=UPI0036D20065
MSAPTIPARDLDRRAWVVQVMGLPVSVHLRGPAVHTDAVAERVQRLFAELRAVDDTFSTYRPESEIGRLAGRVPDPATAGPAVREVVELCERARLRTGGRFDARRLPLPTGGAGFDPSGLVKGWAVERAARLLTDLPGHDLCLNAGGDVLLRTAPGRPAWRVGVEDPDRPGRLLDVLKRRDGAVATSGTARRGAHIVDPRTGRPATALRSVTVVGPELLWADVYATAAMAAGPDALAWLATLEGYAALLLDTAGHLHTTPTWPTPTAPSPTSSPASI